MTQASDDKVRTGFLPADEQRFYDSCVDGLRREGWSRIDAESEALDRIERTRARASQEPA